MFEYLNYNIESKIINGNNHYIKFIDKNTNISFENIIGTEHIDNFPIDKFVKLFNKCFEHNDDYKLKIQNNDDCLSLFLTYDNDIIDLNFNIILKKNCNNCDNFFAKIEQIEKKINDMNKIKIAEIINLHTKNLNVVSVNSQYIKYSPETEIILLNTLDDTIDIINNERNNYKIILNENIKPTEIFTNLKKIIINNLSFLNYFCSQCDYLYEYESKNSSGNIIKENKLVRVIYNNTIEEIEYSNSVKYNSTEYLYCDKIDENNVNTDNIVNINFNENGPSYKNHDNSLNNSCIKNKQIDYYFPNLKKIIIHSIYHMICLHVILHIIKCCKKLNKIKIVKICDSKDTTMIKKISELRTHCLENKIELEINELI